MSKEIYLENKNKIIILGVLLIIFFAFLIYSNIVNKKDIVYTKKQVGESKLPIININNEEISKINENLNNRFEVITKKNNGSYMKYEYFKNKDILSIIVESGIKNLDDEVLEIEYESYNIDLKSNLLMDFDNVINKYNLNESYLDQKFELIMKNQYKEEISSLYIDPVECTYNCYLDLKNYSSARENIQFYIKEDGLYAYLNIQDFIIVYNKDDYPKMTSIYKLQ